MDDCLQVGGRALTALATEAGRTPFHVYDRTVMDRKVAGLRRVLPPEVHLHYAIKANPMPEVVRHMLGLVDGLDVASAGELRTALGAGANPAGVSFAGPGKTDEELEYAAASGITLNVESEREIEVLAAIAQRTGRRPKVAVRVNPDFELKTSGMKMGGGRNSSASMPSACLKRCAGSAPCRRIRGFHFSGSQNLRAEAIVEAQQRPWRWPRASRGGPAPVTLLNIGGASASPISRRTGARSRANCRQPARARPDVGARCRTPRSCSSSGATSSARRACMSAR